MKALLLATALTCLTCSCSVVSELECGFTPNVFGCKKTVDESTSLKRDEISPITGDIPNEESKQQKTSEEAVL